MNKLCLSLAALLAANALVAQSTITPLNTFGTNGWLAPGSASYIATTGNERGFAYNPATGNLVLVSRTGGTFLKVLNGQTGADLGSLVSTGITGGTFVVNMAGVADDGSIYVCNLSTSAAAAFKVYKWDSEALGLANAPSVAYTAASVITRTGDSFAVTGGSGGNPILFAAAGSVAGAAAQNSCFLTGPLDATNIPTPYLNVPGTLASGTNDYRLSLTFVDQDTIIGNQGTNARMTSFNGVSSTLDATIPLGIAQRPLDYAVIDGVPCLAVIDTNSSNVTVYDISIPNLPLALAVGNATTGVLTTNVNATGSVQWGPISGNTATLYAMSSNQGIQAFNVTIDRPARATVIGVGCGSPALALAASAAPVLGTTVNLNTSNLLPTMPITVYALGFTEIPGGITVPIQPFTCTGYLATLDITFLNFSAGNPTDTLPLAFPLDPFFAGVTVFGQAVGLDVNGDWVTTNALRMYMELF